MSRTGEGAVPTTASAASSPIGIGIMVDGCKANGGKVSCSIPDKCSIAMQALTGQIIYLSVFYHFFCMACILYE